jgi:hypothetical protein
MRLINFRCEDCGKDREELFTRDELEEVGELEELEERCECGGLLKKFDYKNNPQVWKFLS